MTPREQITVRRLTVLMSRAVSLQASAHDVHQKFTESTVPTSLFIEYEKLSNQIKNITENLPSNSTDNDWMMPALFMCITVIFPWAFGLYKLVKILI